MEKLEEMIIASYEKGESDHAPHRASSDGMIGITDAFIQSKIAMLDFAEKISVKCLMHLFPYLTEEQSREYYLEYKNLIDGK